MTTAARNPGPGGGYPTDSSNSTHSADVDITLFPQAPLPPSDIPPEVLAWLQGIPPELVIVPILGVLLIGGSVIFLLARAISRRIEGKGTKVIQAEITALHERIAELESGHQRIAELEERFDFSERMLVRSHPEEMARREGMR